MYIYIYNLWFQVTMRGLRMNILWLMEFNCNYFSVFSSCVCLVLLEFWGSITKNYCLKS